MSNEQHDSHIKEPDKIDIVLALRSGDDMIKYIGKHHAASIRKDVFDLIEIICEDRPIEYKASLLGKIYNFNKP